MNKNEIPTPKKCPKCGCTGDKFTLIDLEFDTGGEQTGLLWSCDECNHEWSAE